MSSRQEELRARIDNAIARQQLIVASQESAASAAGRAEGYMNKAADWAAKAHGQVVEDDKYSALHYAEEAAASAEQAGSDVTSTTQNAAAAAASAVLASEWAAKTDGHVEGTEDSAKQHALNASATEASVLDTYAKVADTYEDAVEAARLSAQASADAQEHAHNAADWAVKENAPVEGDLYSARHYAGQASASETNASASAELAEEWASRSDHQPVDADAGLYSSKEYAERSAASAAEAAESAEHVVDAALQGRNNTFTQTNTFNGTVAANGAVVMSDTYGTGAYTAESSELGFFHEVVRRLVARTNFTMAEWKEILPAIKGNLPKDLPLPSSLNVNNVSSLFKDCTHLTRLPDAWTFNGATDIRDIFYGCTHLSTLPPGMTLGNAIYGDSAFNNCKALTSASFPAGMTLSSLVYSSTYGMFNGCTGLESVPFTLDHLVKSGDRYAQGMFFNCTNLKELPNINLASLKEGDYMFYGCQLSADSALRVVRSLTAWDDGQEHVLNLGNSTNFKNSTELASLLEGASVPIANGIYYLLDADGNRTGWKIEINTFA